MLSISILIISSTILTGVAAAIYGISIFGFRTITKKAKFTSQECFKRVEKQKLYSRAKFDNLSKKNIVIKNSEGFKLHGCYIEQFPHSNKVIILVHGYTRTHTMSLRFCDLYLRQGFNILAIDQRAHGNSDGEYTSYGFYEKHDIEQWVKWVTRQKGTDAIIGLHGISLGAGTSLEYLHINQHVKFVVADCPYSNLEQLIRYQIKHLYKAPVFIFYHTIHFFVKLHAKFRFQDVNPIGAVAQSEIPIMFIHGSRDRFIPPQMSHDLFNAKQKGIKRLWIAEGGRHTKAYICNRNGYEQEVTLFLEDVLQFYTVQAVAV
ncbi:MAG: alpha/beta hydrolase [Balneolaceae bacterium]